MKKYQLKAWEKLCRQDSKISRNIPFTCYDKKNKQAIATTGASVLVWTWDGEAEFLPTNEITGLYSQYENHRNIYFENVEKGKYIDVDVILHSLQENKEKAFLIPGTNTYVDTKKLKYLYEFSGKCLY